LQVVDMRTGNYKKAQLKVRAHERDVNVCDWNRVATHLIVTGSDDCTVKVWDLRMVTEKAHDELLCFNWHTEPITSIRFQPNDESVIAVASEDNRLSIWDMAVENEEEDPDVPNELMFLHQGQQ
jgi:ribosome assembly protein RRB1